MHCAYLNFYDMALHGGIGAFFSSMKIRKRDMGLVYGV
jgi:hypothetical protein